jgi:hypothetical protein
MLVLDEGAMAILDAHIDANPYLLPPGSEDAVPPVPQYMVDIDKAYMDRNEEGTLDWPDGTIESDTNPQEQ